MARPRHLSRAPITEAVIDLRVTAREGLTFEQLRAAAEAAEYGYYAKGPITTGKFEATIEASGTTEWTADSQPVGMRLHSRDEHYVMQQQIGGFTLSRLQPYETWDAFVAEARRLWPIYVAQTEPQRVTRVATRFINELPLPLVAGETFQLYVNELIELPPEVPQTMESFLQRFQLRDTTLDARVVLTAALGKARPDQRVPLLLDIDAIMDRSLAPGADDLWQLLQQLRTLKNQIFFGLITERTAGLFE